MAADDEFVTIVPVVGEVRPAPATEPDPAFVTVLTVGAAAGAAEVLVRRPRGARLGLGLKFEGGSAAAEKVRRLLVQTCATDSPAANAVTPWGKLIPGDEILAIDGHPVLDLTRIDCVRRLKNSEEILKLLVRHLDDENEFISKATAKPQEIQRPTCLPPPVPPRKLNKKNSFKDRSTPFGDHNMKSVDGTQKSSTENLGTLTNGRACDINVSNKLSRKSSFDSHIHRQSKESITAFTKSSPEEVRRLVRRLSDGKTIPPEAEIYTDLISQEREKGLIINDAESDDTGSSISTVVDRLGSMASSVENSIPSTPIMQQKTIDIKKVLNCIENIDSDLLNDIATSRLVDKPVMKNKEKTESRKDIFKDLDETDCSLLLDEKITKNNVISDKNNNKTIVRNITCINLDSSAQKQMLDKPKSNFETYSKPKPLPRSTRLELTEKQDINTHTESESLLTPTKKTCIESWLQRSEAELTTKKSEETPPEALPRLIDFVPKPQFREMTAIVTQKPSIEINEESEMGLRAEVVVEKRSELPTPPPENREDGSGASLDTIGELDEGIDTTNTEDNAGSDKNEGTLKKYDSAFWDGRMSRSDAEDCKSLSNDETPTPTFPRQPPDGVETPCDAVEKTSESVCADIPPPLPTSSPSALRLTARMPPSWPSTRERVRTSYSRSQDARSECSVKDKIAMFSADSASSADAVDRCDTQLPSRPNKPVCKNHILTQKNNYLDIQNLDRRLTKSQDNLDEVPKTERLYSHSEKRPEVLGASTTPRTYSESTETKSRYRDFGTLPMHYGSTTNLMTFNQSQRSDPVYHTRSVSDDGNNSAYKSTLEYIIEQRKKSMSKLRGLMIPELQGPIVDLPEIKVKESNAIKKLLSNNRHANGFSSEKNKQKSVLRAPLNLAESLKLNLLPNNIPKYSPAFKRKSLQVYSSSSNISKESTPERKLDSPIETRLFYTTSNGFQKNIPSKPPRNVTNVKKLYNDKINLNNALRPTVKSDKNLHDTYREYGNVDIKVCTATDIVDSDNDSAVSSTQSSYRSSASSPLHNMDSVESDSSCLSPRSSHYISYSLVKTEQTKTQDIPKLKEYEKRNICRSISSDTNASLSSSAGSAATFGSQASCSSLESSVADSGKKKVTRTHSIDTMNRRSILASAKCRSGRDNNAGSPVVESKFIHDSSDRSPSPHRKSSDRLSTLASSVSGLSSKGEVRRTRSKVISDTDSDSENELNVRQRKSDFKNSRIKKLTNSQTVKVEPARKKMDSSIADNIVAADDVPQIISQRIIKEINKAGLHDIVSDKTKTSNKQNISPAMLSQKVATNGFTPKITKEKEVSSTVSTSYSIQDSDVKKLPPTETVTKIMSKSSSGDLSMNKSFCSYKVCLKKGVGAGVGLILAGGVDCEAKVITVHKVLAGSVAEREGLQRGVRVLSINGTSMEGLTHAQTVAVLKEQRSEVIIEIANEKQENNKSPNMSDNESRKTDVNGTGKETEQVDSEADLVEVTVEKSGAGAGLGFGLEGGKDSPNGDLPLTIKKLFAGGAAARTGRVLVGAELVRAGDRDLRGLTRTQAWAALKELPTGSVSLLLKNPR